MGIFKNLLAIVIGMVSGSLILMLSERYLSIFYELPAGIDVNNKQQMSDAIAHMPLSAFVFLLIIYTVCACIGGIVATLLSERVTQTPALVVGALLTVEAIVKVAAFSQPAWFVIFNLLCYIPATLAGYQLVRKRTGIKANAL